MQAELAEQAPRIDRLGDRAKVGAVLRAACLLHMRHASAGCPCFAHRLRLQVGPASQACHPAPSQTTHDQLGNLARQARRI